MQAEESYGPRVYVTSSDRSHSTPNLWTSSWLTRWTDFHWVLTMRRRRHNRGRRLSNREPVHSEFMDFFMVNEVDDRWRGRRTSIDVKSLPCIPRRHNRNRKLCIPSSDRLRFASNPQTSSWLTRWTDILIMRQRRQMSMGFVWISERIHAHLVNEVDRHPRRHSPAHAGRGDEKDSGGDL